jgi:alginate O-acetyltransferase complex protein AlgI
VFAWIFFRSKDLTNAFQYINEMFVGLINPGSYLSAFLFVKQNTGFLIPVLIVFFLVVEWLGRAKQFAIAELAISFPKPLRWSFYYMVMIIIILYGGREQQFIYFQF